MIPVKPAVRPNNDGVPVPMLVRHHVTRRPLPADVATEIDETEPYYARLLRDGDLIPEPAPKAAKAPSPNTDAKG